MIELVEHDALHLDVGDLVLLGDELLVHDLERVDVARVLLLGPHHLGVGANAVDLAELEVGGGELLLRRAEGDPPCGGRGGGSDGRGGGGRRGRGWRMREAQPGCEVPLHGVVVAADRHGGCAGGIYRVGARRRARGPRKAGRRRRRRGLRWRRRSTGGTIGFGFEGWESGRGRNRWDCDGRSLWRSLGSLASGAAAAAGRNGAEERNRIESRDATGGER